MYTVLLSLLFLLTTRTFLLAKGETVRIRVEGADLAAPIEITDPLLLKKFQVWTGPGTSSNEGQGFIIDWSRGFIAKVPPKVRVYTVSFFANLPREKLVSVVLYAYDSSAGERFVFLPGRGDRSYWLNVGSILHGLEVIGFTHGAPGTRWSSHRSRRLAKSRLATVESSRGRSKSRYCRSGLTKKSDCSQDSNAAAY